MRVLLTGAGGFLGSALKRRLENLGLRLGAAAGRLDAISPLGVLARGYAIATSKGKVLTSARQVKAGENAGETLKHDHVVRQYQPVASWPAGTAQRWTLAVNAGVAEHPRRVAFVLVDAATQKPIHAVSLGC